MRVTGTYARRYHLYSNLTFTWRRYTNALDLVWLALLVQDRCSTGYRHFWYWLLVCAPCRNVTKIIRMWDFWCGFYSFTNNVVRWASQIEIVLKSKQTDVKRE